MFSLPFWNFNGISGVKLTLRVDFLKPEKAAKNSTTSALVALRKTRENQWWSREMLAVFSG